MPEFTLNPLLIPELFQCILDCLLPTIPLSREPAKQKALVVLAQVCRATSEPSIDRIWRVLPSLEPLIWCSRGLLDEESHNEDPDDEDPDEERTLDELEEMIPPTPAEWIVIGRYTHRVRQVVVAFETQSLRILKCIGTQQSALFPNLKRLFWHPYRLQLYGSIPLIRSLLNHSLVELRATFTVEDGVALRSFLNDCPRQCPNLKAISFDFCERGLISHPLTESLSKSICYHENLESVSVSFLIDDIALRHLALSPTLKELSIVYHPRHMGSQVSFLPGDIPFLNVEHLNLVTSDLDMATSLLRPHHQMFHSFTLNLPYQPSARTISAFLSVLASRPHAKPLRQLRIRYSRNDPLPVERPPTEELERYCLTYQSLKPLTPLVFLSHLFISWKYPISINDDELADLARSWPSLQILSFDCCRGVYDTLLTTYPTLKGLLALIASCRYLCGLSLPIDAREVPTDEELGNHVHVHNTGIHNLEFPESPIIHARPVAEFLSRHFPYVSEVIMPYSRRAPREAPRDRHLRGYYKTWSQVATYLKPPSETSGIEEY